MRRIGAAIALVAVLSGCASVPMGDARDDAALKSFSVEPNGAGIFIYRNESMGGAIKMDVAIDGVELGQTAAKTYLYAPVAPGRHTVTSKAENTDTLEVTVQPGTLTYIWQEVKMGALYARTKLHVVDETQGRRGVQETRLAASKGVVGARAMTALPPSSTAATSAAASPEAPARLDVGSRLTFRDGDPITGVAHGESTFVVAAGEPGQLTFNDGSIVIAADGLPIKGALQGGTIYGYSPQQLARGGSWKGSFRVPGVTPDVPVDITMLRSEERIVSGRRFQAARLRVDGFATRQLLQGHATNAMGAPFSGELLVDKATGLVLDASVTSRNASYAFQRTLTRITAN